MKRRTIKATPEGELSRSRVREAIRAAHVQAKGSGAWEVKTLGTGGRTRQFSSKEAAVSYAQRIPTASSVVVHGEGQVVKLPAVSPRNSGMYMKDQ